jgi:plastocyanin
MRRWMWGIVALFAVMIPAGTAIRYDIRPAAAAQDHKVAVDDSDRDERNWKWVPEEVTVAAGETVTWDMTGAKMPHSAAADDGSWDSGYVVEGAKWTRTFDKAGDYHYHCGPHPWKKGVIHVK